MLLETFYVCFLQGRQKLVIGCEVVLLLRDTDVAYCPLPRHSRGLNLPFHLDVQNVCVRLPALDGNVPWERDTNIPILWPHQLVPGESKKMMACCVSTCSWRWVVKNVPGITGVFIPLSPTLWYLLSFPEMFLQELNLDYVHQPVIHTECDGAPARGNNQFWDGSPRRLSKPFNRKPHCYNP